MRMAWWLILAAGALGLLLVPAPQYQAHIFQLETSDIESTISSTEFQNHLLEKIPDRPILTGVIANHPLTCTRLSQHITQISISAQSLEDAQTIAEKALEILAADSLKTPAKDSKELEQEQVIDRAEAQLAEVLLKRQGADSTKLSACLIVGHRVERYITAYSKTKFDPKPVPLARFKLLGVTQIDRPWFQYSSAFLLVASAGYLFLGRRNS